MKKYNNLYRIVFFIAFYWSLGSQQLQAQTYASVYLNNSFLQFDPFIPENTFIRFFDVNPEKFHNSYGIGANISHQIAPQSKLELAYQFNHVSPNAQRPRSDCDFVGCTIQYRFHINDFTVYYRQELFRTIRIKGGFGVSLTSHVDRRHNYGTTAEDDDIWISNFSFFKGRTYNVAIQAGCQFKNIFFDIGYKQSLSASHPDTKPYTGVKHIELKLGYEFMIRKGRGRF